MTNTITTATVETLTAEVRVLMVGSRQVTLSVYRQLDWKPFTDIEPFGRVRATKTTEYDDRTVEIVGKSTDGNLVRSAISPPDWQLPAPPEFGHWMVHRLPQSDASQGHRRVMSAPYGPHKLVYCLETGYNGSITSADYCPIWYGKHHRYIPEKHPEYRLPNGEVNPDWGLWEWLNAESEYHCHIGDSCKMGQLEDVWRAAVDADYAQLVESQDNYATAAALPLIVLAGLR